MGNQKSFLEIINGAAACKASIYEENFIVTNLEVVKAVKDMYSKSKAQLFTSGAGIITIDIGEDIRCESIGRWTKYDFGHLQLYVAA